ncbi:response regulator transcription factor [Streptomyces bathyalis]|uniref:Response regulator transcription factor n=1 Tax=Streptomyces bathyalis TaxID=2710756 RepID=A0A7T1T6R5_9ACTN|nr:response regulator transcription factor [Streptomyces bathyalis]QPP07416.1 response regulator transcription factor [Streptomyces bathyalis]
MSANGAAGAWSGRAAAPGAAGAAGAPGAAGAAGAPVPAGGDRGRVLVVDDDAAIRRSLSRGLRLNGFAVELAEGGRRALSLMRERPADVVVLDISMPDVNGIQVCQSLRDGGDDVPVLMLSALDETADRIAGLQAGGDDYLVKPFALQELVLRLDALLRRRAPAPGAGGAAAGGAGGGGIAGAGPGPGHGAADASGPGAIPGAAEAVRVGGLVLNPATREAHREGDPLPLTRREFELLLVLARNAGIVLTRDQLLERVWGYDFEVRTDAVDTFISYLRRKTESGGRPRLLQTVRGVGFVLREEK